MTTFLSDIVLAGANDIQFKNTSGANTGKIESDGDNLVLSNAVGDILLGDGASDVYIGDGTNNVDILFEVSGSLSAESGATLTLGGAGGTLAIGSAISLADAVSAISGTGVNTIDIGTSAKPFKNIYAAHHVGGSSINYATSRGWVERSAPMSGTNVGEFGGNFVRNGAAAENAIVWGLDPFGNKALLWKAIMNTSDDNDDGGWNKEIVVPANNNIGYLSYVYFKVDFTPNSGTQGSKDGTVYLGAGQVAGETINVSNGSNNTNPYFVSKSLFEVNDGGPAVANKWYLIVGVLQAYNNSTTDTDTLAGVYDVETGEKVSSGGEFKMGNNTTGQKHRAYIYYDQSTDNENAYFWNPGFHAIDGSEPKIQDLVKRQVYLDDNVKAAFGTGNDLEIYHDASNTYIKNETGNLILQNNADDADIAFYSDDQSGSVAEYLRLDGSMGISRIFKALRANDDVKFQAGSGGDLDIFHSGTAATIENKTGNLTIKNSTDDGDIIFQSDDGSGGTTAYLTLDGGISSILVYKDILMANDGNDGKIKFGASQDLQIYHDGSNSFIKDTGTGDLYIDSSINFFVRNQANGEVWIKGTDGGVSLRYQDNQKIITTNTGIDVTGNIAVSGTVDGIDIATRDAVLTSTTTTANAALPKAGGTMSGAIAMGNQNITGAGTITGTTLTGTSLDINGSADISGDLTGVDNLTATTLNITNYGLASGDIPNNAADTTGSAAQATNLNATDDRDMAPEDYGYTNDFRIFFTSKEGLEDGTSTGSNWQDALYINSYTDASGGDANVLAFDKSEKKIYHYQADQAATNWGTAKQLAYTDSDISGDTTGNAATATTLATARTIAGVSFNGSANISLNNNAITNGAGYTGDQSQSDINALAITTVGTISEGEWRGTRISTVYQHQRQTFDFKGYSTHDGTNYEIPQAMTDTNAPFEHNTSVGSAGTTAISVSLLLRAGGQVMPYAGTIKKWTGWAAGSGSGTINLALFRYRPDTGNSSAQSLVLIDDQALTAAGAQTVVTIEQTSFTNGDIAAGDIIMTGIKGVSSKTTYFTSTMEIEWD